MGVVACHPLVAPPPGGVCWRRRERGRPAGAPAETHRELVVLLGLAGRARYLLDGAVHELREGMLLWALAGQTHVLLSDAADFDMWVFVISQRVLAPDSGPEWPPLSVESAALPSPRLLTPQATRDLSALADQVAAAGDPSLRRTGLRWWLARAWALWQQAPTGATRRVHPAVARAARLLRERPNADLDTVARTAGLSRDRLARLFRAQIGMALIDYRNDQRLAGVAAAVESGQHNLLAAALQAGFGSYAQFFRICVARRGCNPRRAFLSPRPE